VFFAFIRGATRAAAVFVALQIALVHFALLTRMRGRHLTTAERARWMQTWCRWTLRLLGIVVDVQGEPPKSGLWVANHLSYLDILVFSAVCGCVFVSKKEVKSWPAVGWISSLAGTIYIDRTRRTETHAIQLEMQSALSSNLLLVLFPEGTSSDGSSVLRFHSSLFQPVIDLDMLVTAASIDYVLPDGDAAREACYWGDMTLLPHVFNLLSKDAVRATLSFSEEPLQFWDRKQAAQTTQMQVERLRGNAHSP